MTAATPIPERLAELDALNLKAGSHSEAEFGKLMCVMEAVAYVSGENRTDHPACACPVLTSLLIRWNDRLGEGEHGDKERDRLLKPLVARLVGSRSTHVVEQERRRLLREWTRSAPLADWLELAKFQEHADAVRANPGDMKVIGAARKAAWDARWARRKDLRAKVEASVKKELAKKPAAVAAAVAADAAVAVAAAAAAVADAAVAAAAAAVAVADAADAVADAAADAADAVADADAAAAAAAAADAAADAADAVADAAADAVAVAADPWGATYNKVYAAVKPIYEAAIQKDPRFAALSEKHTKGLLQTIDAMLEVTPESLAA